MYKLKELLSSRNTTILLFALIGIFAIINIKSIACEQDLPAAAAVEQETLEIKSPENTNEAGDDDKENLISQEGKVVVNKSVFPPKYDILIDGNVHVEAEYYENDITGDEYGDERRQFDRDLFDAIEEMSNNVIDDIIVKHKSFLGLGGHVGTIKNLVGKFLPEYSRLVNDGKHGRPAKDEFLGDAIAMWWQIQEKATKEASIPLPTYEVKDSNGRLDKQKTKLAQEKAKKESEDKFLINFHKFMNNLKQTVYNSPVGVYLNWKNIKINGESVIDVGTPFLTHLRRYNLMSIKILNLMMNVLGHIKL